MEPRTLAQHLLARALRRRSYLQERRQGARHAGKIIRQALKERFGIKRVLLFGSCAGPERLFHERSDLDLAVEGLAESDRPAAAALAEELAPLPVDLVRIEAAGETLRERILAEAEVIDDSWQ